MIKKKEFVWNFYYVHTFQSYAALLVRFCDLVAPLVLILRTNMSTVSLSVAEFKEFEPRLNYGWFHNLNRVLADLSRDLNSLNSSSGYILKHKNKFVLLNILNLREIFVRFTCGVLEEENKLYMRGFKKDI